MLVGDFVETIYGVNGILIAIKDTYYGEMAFIVTSDGRIFHCPVSVIKGGNTRV